MMTAWCLGAAACFLGAVSGADTSIDLPQVLDAAKQRALGQSAPSKLCSTSAADGRPNFFLLWPLHPAQFGQLAYAVVESVLFHHPSANVIVVSVGLQVSLFDTYLSEGYCVASIPMQLEQSRPLFASVLPAGPVSEFLQVAAAWDTEEHLAFFLNAVVLAFQVLYGGVSIGMDGMLLNPIDFMLPRQLSLSNAAIFTERLLDMTGSPSAAALQAEDFDQSWLPRSHTDRADGFTLLCLEFLCPRSIPAGSIVGQTILLSWFQASLDPQVQQIKAVPEISEFGTKLYRLYVQKWSKPPFSVGDLHFNHEIVVLPYWTIVEPHFPDGWKAFGGHDDPNARHTQVFSPRPLRDSSDWSLVSSAKLWLPLGYGPPSARNILPNSVVDMALRHFTLGIMPRPYHSKSFGLGRKGGGKWERRLHTPKDPHVGFSGHDAASPIREVVLPGVVGGFRSFRHIRLVGRDHGVGASLSSLSTWRVLLRVNSPRLVLFCRSEQRPIRGIQSPGMPGSAAFHACERALQQAGSAPGSPSGSPPRSTHVNDWTLRFDACGTPGELNAALTLLAVKPIAGLGTPPRAAGEQRSSDFRLTESEIESHYGDLWIEASPGCAGNVVMTAGTRASSISSELSVLLDDVEDHVTVVAHCAERCHLLDRLGKSFREVYERLPIIVTCECAEDEHCPEPVEGQHASIAGMTVVRVPYDFGLSRGKTLLTRLAKTEFVLVLDDDFVHSFHSCLECMLWRMRSRYHSLWRPFDILGFPVLEDERLFGAFRGRLRIASHQMFLEPMIEQITPDGCLRLDICPMVFLARTARLRIFKFQEDLRVGEHEQFFYSNAYLGLQVAVCFDSSYPHFRVNTMSAGYVKRRERMPALMKSAFEKLGFQRAMFLFKKYDLANAEDYDELLDKTVPPWYISDDTCGHRAAPPVPFAQLFAVILSTGDEAGVSYRQVLRGQTGAAAVWLQRFAGLGTENFRWMFAVSVQDYPRVPDAVLKEQDEYRDVIFLSKSSSEQQGAVGFGTEQFLQLLALLRDFQFRWLLVAQQDVFIHADRLLTLVQGQEPGKGKVIGAWRQGATPVSAGMQQRLEPQLYVLSRDIFALISSPAVNSRLSTTGLEASSFGDLANLNVSLNAWLHPLAVDRVNFPGMHIGQGSPIVGPLTGCPKGTVALHPVSPGELHALSLSADMLASC